MLKVLSGLGPSADAYLCLSGLVKSPMRSWQWEAHLSRSTNGKARPISGHSEQEQIPCTDNARFQAEASIAIMEGQLARFHVRP